MDKRELSNFLFAFIVLITMILIDWAVGSMLMDFAIGQGGLAGWIIQLMVTFALGFGTFVVPLLIFYGIFVNPLNIMMGIGSILIGMPVVIFVVNGLTLIVEVTGLAGGTLVIANFFMIVLILFFGFIMPIYLMLQEESVVPLDVSTGMQR